MALKNLSIGAMVSVGSWLMQARAESLMGKDSVVQGYAPRIKRDTGALEKVQVSLGVVSKQLASLTDAAAEQDAANDKVLGIFDDGARVCLRACEDETLREAIRAAYEKAVAAGRAALVLGAYAGMGGEAKRIEASLTAEDWAALRKAKVADTNLEELLKRWLKGAHALTKIDQERAELAVMEDTTRTSSGDVAQARNQWVRTMNAFVAAVRSSDLTQAEQDELLSVLIKAEEDADRAAAARRAGKGA
jgi:hypothetical protein